MKPKAPKDGKTFCLNGRRFATLDEAKQFAYVHLDAWISHTTTDGVFTYIDVVCFERNKSVMIKLTPEEIKNIMREAAEKWHNAKMVDTPHSMDYIIDFHYDIIFGILRQTDPDRFDFKN